MSLRPVQARWFELLATREDLHRAVETLAGTGSIELETRSGTRAVLSLQNLQQRMEEFNRLAQRYGAYWPRSELWPAPVPGKPGAVFDAAMRNLRDWEQAARPLILVLESLAGEQADLQLVEEMLEHARDGVLDFGLLARPGGALASRLYALPVHSRIGRLPAAVLSARLHSAQHDFLLAVGLPADLAALDGELAGHKGRVVALPADLQGTRPAALREVRRRNAALAARRAQLRAAIDACAGSHHLRAALTDIHRLGWFVSHVSTFPVSENFAWITGWTSDLEDDRLSTALHAAGVNAVLHFPPPPRGVDAPLMMRNPGWAQPFEVFARLLGTPAGDEVDPSRVLAVLTPLLFGYMFGDLGHGLVLVLAGLALQKRWPVTRLLLANGLAAMIFGLVFGSVFGREDIVPALWVNPAEDPLPVLLVPLAGGVVILLLGLLFNAVEAGWRGELERWWRMDAAVLVLYLALIGSLLHPVLLGIAALATLWYFTGCLRQAREHPAAALAGAAGSLLESVFQLLINTVSFVRVGAFALAHAGLSLAFLIMAEAAPGALGAFLVLLFGNMVVIMLEGLVVTVQTTRLILFEFFIRFLRGSGRMFRPLAAPAAQIATGRMM